MLKTYTAAILFILATVVNAQWYGSTHPGEKDPSDPTDGDWHCDRHGLWHNDEHDEPGHRDARCHPW